MGRLNFGKHRKRASFQQNQPKRRSRSQFELLEQRCMLTSAINGALPTNVFATFDGAITASGGKNTIPIHITPADFGLTSGLTTLGFDVVATGSSTMAPAIAVVTDSTGHAVAPLFSATMAKNSQSLSLLQLGTGNYSVAVAAQPGSSGAYQLQVFLAADVNGDRMVTPADATAIQSAYGSLAGQAKYNVAADMNLDGAINAFDLATYTRARNDTTDINPLVLSAQLATPSPLATLSDGSSLIDTHTISLSGTSFKGVTVQLDDNGNGYSSGSTVAGNAGIFSLPATLSEGLNALTLRATDSFGQQRIVPLSITTNTTGPAIVAQLAHDTGSSAVDGITNDLTLNGNIFDSASITKLAAGFDTTPSSGYTNILNDLNHGDFTLAAAELTRINGGTPIGDGLHVIHFSATDATTRTGTFDLAFTLKSSAIAPTFALSIGSQTQSLGDHKTTLTAVTLVGQTEGNRTITLSNGATANSDAGGHFTFNNVPLTPGSNSFTAAVVDVAGNSGNSNQIIFQLPAVQSGGSVALSWDAAALAALQVDASTPEFASRMLAIMSAAMYDAGNSVDNATSFLYIHAASPSGASDVAAVAQAAHDVLAYTYPAQTANFDALLASSFAAVSDATARSKGVSVGQQVAATILQMRANDGYLNYVNYLPGTSAGVWIPTYPAYMPAENPQWATLKPFMMTGDNQFRSPGPTALSSAQWQADYNQVMSLGAVNSTTRTSDQTQIARFWNDPTGTATPPGHWNMIASTVAGSKNLNLSDTTRMLAELNTALGDAAIVAWDDKYNYNFWRPITAIPVGGGNAALTADANWKPLLTTPPFPEYVSGHSTFSGAAAAVLDSFFGANTPFTIGSTSQGVTGITRSYTGFDQAADEAAMSRVYAGIHYLTSINDGLTAGTDLGNFVLERFGDLSDSAAPTVTFNNSQNQAVKSNPPITGTVSDNLSGVATLTGQFDTGATFPVVFHSSGQFSVTPAFALNATADGIHVLHLIATDKAGNTSGSYNNAFTVDTVAPTISLTSPAGQSSPIALSAGDLISGVVDGTGSAITSLCYRFDSGVTVPISFGTDGSFSQPLDLSKLSAGLHTLTIATTDAAGNVTSQHLSVSLAATISLTVTSYTPAQGSSDVGTTFRPKVYFSRPIDSSTLNADDFYLSDSTGDKVATSIVLSDDGTYAWLFPAEAMPGASTMTVTVDGTKIRSADGAYLDASGTGSANGSVLTFSFSTVSTALLSNTSLIGTLADPGPDLRPGTMDDVLNGADGLLGTTDDVYKLPIAGVTVSIVGTSLTTTTDINGHFSFPSIPAGDIKLDVDGTTATNPPAGYYFPVMVMDLQIQPGVPNTVMAAMQIASEGNSHPGKEFPTAPGVYLPRVATAILQTISDTQPTTVDVPVEAAPDLTPEQRERLTLTVQPNSAIGEDGQVISNLQIGISTVPTSLIKDMLPVGVQQPAFTITVQAPGVASFSTPIKLTFPNVYNAAPGTKQLFMSFDHTTGRMEVEGTATVSADGLSVVTDPDGGLTHPGWHFVVTGSTNGDALQQQDQTKTDYANISKLIAEYKSSGYVDSTGRLTELGASQTQNAVTNAELALFFPFPIAGEYFNHWLDNNGEPLGPESEVNQDAASKLLADSNFQSQVVAADKQAILNQVPGTVRDFQVNLIPHQFKLDTLDLEFALTRGTIAFSSVRGSGTVSEDGKTITSGELVYTGTLIYGFGLNDATSPARAGSLSQREFFDLRPLQLLGRAQPFTTTIVVTVPLGDSSQRHALLKANTGETSGFSTQGPLATQSEQLESTVSGFGSDPSIYYRFVLASGFEISGKTDKLGNLNKVVFPADTDYTGTFYSPSTNLWTSVYGRSGPSGRAFGLEGQPSSIYLDHFGGVDSTGDGLPDIARYVMGLKVGVRSFAGDGIDDAVKLAQGLDPFSGIAFPTGVIASLPIPGTVEKLAVDGNRIYAAAGSGGIAVIDGSQFNKPILLGRLPLSGYASGIGVDGNLSLAAVATGSALQLVDVSNGATPKLVRTVAVPASQVVVAGGIAYAASGNRLSIVDMQTGVILQSLTLPMFGVTGAARDGNFLYIYGGNVLAVVDTASPGAARVRGQLFVSIASSDVGVFAANGVVWLAGSGLRTVNVSNPDAPTLIHSADNFFTARRVALNGSGLGVLAPAGNSYVEVYDTSSPNVTANQLLQIPLTSGASDVVISRGIAYVGENGQLQVVNYEPFDTKGIAPTVSISALATDIDLAKPGLQLLEGSNLPIEVSATDDVQVRDVQLLVNGKVVQDAVSFPFDLSAILPSIIQSGSSSVTIQVLATDTGGNVGASNVLTIGLETDTSPPTINSLTPANGATLLEGLQAVRIGFSKPLDASTVNAATFKLLDAQGNVVTAINIQLQNNGQLVQLAFSYLPAGQYQLLIDGANVMGRNGIAMDAGIVIETFTLTPRETLTIVNPDADAQTAGLQLNEATTVKGTIAVDSSVTVQRIDLLVDGIVVSTGTTAPMSFAFIAPLLSSGKTSITLVARVTDANGVVTSSAPRVITLLRDTAPPAFVGTTPSNGGHGFNQLQLVQVNFSEPIVPTSVSVAAFQLTGAGPDGLFGTDDDLSIPINQLTFVSDNTVAQLTIPALNTGSYRITMSEEGIVDRAGNALGTGTFTSTFGIEKAGVLLLADTTGPGPAALQAALQAAGIPVTTVTPDYLWNGSNPSLAPFSTVIMLDGTTYSDDLPISAQIALEDFVRNGGGFIGSQWNGFQRNGGRLANMPDLVLQNWDSNNNFGGNITYTTVFGQSGHPVLAGIPSSFTFIADWNDAAPLFTFTSQPPTVLMTSTGGGPGVIVRDFGTGHVVNFSIAPDYDQSQQTLLNPIIDQLYINAVYWASQNSTSSLSAGGLNAQFYALTTAPTTSLISGNPSSLDSLTPTTNTTVSSVDFNSLNPLESIGVDVGSSNLAASFKGLINIETPGTVTFSTISDDGSVLWIDGNLVVDNSGFHSTKQAFGTVALTAGFHAIEIDYIQGSGASDLVALYQLPGQSMQIIPQSALFTGAPSSPIPGGLTGRFYHFNAQPAATVIGTLPSGLDALTAEKTLIVPNVNYHLHGISDAFGVADGMFGDQDNLAASFTGYIFIPSAGVVTFFTASDDGSILYINGTVVVNNDFAQGLTERSGTFNFTQAGYYPIRLDYYQGTGDAGLALSYTPVGGSKQVIPQPVLFTANPSDPSTGTASPGLNGRYYWIPAGTSPATIATLGALDTITPTTTNTVSQINFSTVSNPLASLGIPYGAANVAAIFSGYIFINSAEPITFYTRSDDGSVLYIDGQLVVSNDFVQGMTERSGTITLSPGYHSIRLEWFQGSGPSAIQLLYSTPSVPEQVIPSTMLYYVPAI